MADGPDLVRTGHPLPEAASFSDSPSDDRVDDEFREGMKVCQLCFDLNLTQVHTFMPTQL